MAQLPLHGPVHIRVTEKVTLDNLKVLIEHIAKEAGCPACGLVGIDLRLRGDPAELHQIARLPGVAAVTAGR